MGRDVSVRFCQPYCQPFRVLLAVFRPAGTCSDRRFCQQRRGHLRFSAIAGTDYESARPAGSPRTGWAAESTDHSATAPRSGSANACAVTGHRGRGADSIDAAKAVRPAIAVRGSGRRSAAAVVLQRPAGRRSGVRHGSEQGGRESTTTGR